MRDTLFALAILATLIFGAVIPLVKIYYAYNVQEYRWP